MFKFTEIPEDTFKRLQLNAGVLMNSFEKTYTTKEVREHIVAATSGGIEADAVPQYKDLGDGIDNCPLNTAELKQLQYWLCTLSGTFVNFDVQTAILMLSAADVDEDGEGITLRNYLKTADFKDLWWVGDFNDGEGYVAANLKNALSTGGMKIKSSDKDKGKSDFEFTGHYSIKDQDTVPMKFYIVESVDDEDETATTSVKPETEDSTESTTNGTEVEAEG